MDGMILGLVCITASLGAASARFVAAIGVLPFLGEVPALADEGQGGQEDYPVSRFGFPPPRPGMGLEPGFASREAQSLDSGRASNDPGSVGASDEQSGGGATNFERRPAGLEFSSGRASSPRNDTASSSPSSDILTLHRKGVQEVALIEVDLGFFPKTLFVSRDVPVRLYVTGSSKNALCIMMDSFQVRKQVRSQRIEEITFTPTVPGRYRFYCPVNGGEGTLVVKDLSTDAALSEPVSGLAPQSPAIVPEAGDRRGPAAAMGAVVE